MVKEFSLFKKGVGFQMTILLLVLVIKTTWTQSLLETNSTKNATIVCPKTVCNCSEPPILNNVPLVRQTGGVMLDCRGLHLGDAAVSKILHNFLYNSSLSPLGALDLSYNNLTHVPYQIAFFNKLEWIELEGNSIISIKSGTFHFEFFRYGSLFLRNNQISYIGTKAFQGTLQYFKNYAYQH